MTQEQLSVDMGYNKGYISQVISRGVFPRKFVNLLKAKYPQPEERQAALQDYNIVAALKKTEAMSEVILSAVAELLARTNGQSYTIVREQLQELVNKRLSEPGLE